MVNFLRQKIIIMSFFLSCFAATAQQLAVESFNADETDQAAHAASPRKDQNDKVCAIVKVETPLLLQDFTLDTAGTGIVHTEQKSGEIWIYLSPGTAQITLAHKQLGAVSYKFGEALKEATAYAMKLKSESTKTVVTDSSAALQRMEVLRGVEGATVSIDGAAPDTLTNGKFGKLTINTQPEQGADVFIDGVKRGQSPLIVERIGIGKHTIRAEKAQFLPATQEKNVTESVAGTLTLKMTSSSALITITAGGGADIYVNDEKMATARWSGKLDSGKYRVEARKPSHRSAVATLVAKAGEKKTIALAAPTPIYGSLSIKTGKVRAAVFVDGKRYGTTPATVKRVLAGSRNVELQANGYHPYKQTVEVQKDTMLTMDVVLAKKDTTGTLVISANTKAKVSVNGEDKGYVPITVDDLPLIRTEVLFTADGYRPLMGVGVVAPGKTNVHGEMDVIPIIMLDYIMSPPTSYFGLSAGYCKSWGGYFQYRADWKMEEKANLMRINEYFTGGQKKYFRASTTAGGILRLFDFMWIYGGMGYGKYGAVYQMKENRAMYTAGLIKGLELEFGAKFKVWKIFSVSAGYSTIAWSDFGELHFGVGLMIPLPEYF
ncbi:MAG: PEGA domain-containing protein [Prevotellaceae bacterium]|jgi:hypothetical protein|nr:PEGA domain-containing protein [Prevotellaceae bacterium]